LAIPPVISQGNKTIPSEWSIKKGPGTPRVAAIEV
jgi:hypothetical protein